ncbi:MAG: cytochrome P450 [Cyanobacteriota bacterium]|nr:cytochrome P450 [Cyanobacteriota bacterium]
MATIPALRPLPRRKGFLIGLRESLAYLRDPDGFIAERAEELGPVFGTTLFFRPTAVVGGPAAVEEFTARERVISESSLPAPFHALHTPDGALNQSGERHRATRAGYQSLFTSRAFEGYLPVLNRAMTAFTDQVARQGHTFIARDGKILCLNMFAELFAGESLTPKEIEAFITYNNALLSLSQWLPSFRRGMAALTFLRERMGKRLERFQRGDLPSACFTVFSANRDERDQPWSEERIATATILLIWGAYIEVASLMAHTLILSEGNEEVREHILAEAARRGLGERSASGTLAQWDLPYTAGVVRESLRLIPPAGGGFRLAAEDVAIAGFRIPAGTVITADPRIGNRMAMLHPEPQLFRPERWVKSTGTTSRCPFAGSASLLPKGAWFPGGIGVHGCPGIPLAELSGRLFLVRWMQAIQRWRQPEDRPVAIPYTLVPIKIPTDAFRLLVEAAEP